MIVFFSENTDLYFFVAVRQVSMMSKFKIYKYTHVTDFVVGQVLFYLITNVC